MASGRYRLQVGKFDCLIIKDGSKSRPPLSEFMAPPPEGLEGYRMTMLGGLMLVEWEGSRVLIDAGNEPEYRERTHHASTAFREEGIAAESIDRVLITHGDPDHIGGLLTEGGELTYPNARAVLHQELWDAWQTDPDRGRYFPSQAQFVRRLADLLENRVDPVRVPVDVAQGIRAIPAPGHRCGHTIYLLESMGEKLLHIGDAAFDPVFLEHPDCANVHDTEPKEACASRRMIVERAAAENLMIVASHFPLPGVGRLRKLAKERFAWTPALGDMA